MKIKNSFIIPKSEIEFVQTLCCGQIFSYKIVEDGFVVYSKDKKAEIKEQEDHYIVFTDDIPYFKNFFDLNTSYMDIKNQLSKHKILEKPISFGSGIRILKQDLLEVIISFAISANNRISRIMSTLFYIREHFGKKIEDYYAFPTLDELKTITEDDFKLASAGYRSKQLVKLVRQLSECDFYNWGTLPSDELKNKLIALSGVGPKVADCIMLFGYGKADVFPVDTWIEKMFNEYFGECHNRIKIRQELVKVFGNLSGYAQQYLFYYQREDAKNKN